VLAGFEVEEEQTFAHLLGKDLTSRLGVSVQVINAGVRGYGTDQEFLYYRERGRQLRPDAVLIMLGNNDFEDNVTLHRARRPFGKAAFSLADGARLHVVGHPIPAYPFCSAYQLNQTFAITRIDSGFGRFICRIQASLADHSAFLTFVSMRIQQNPRLVKTMFDLGTPKEQAVALSAERKSAPPIRLTSEILLSLNAEVKRDGAQLIVCGAKRDLDLVDLAALENKGAWVVQQPDIMESSALMFRNDSHPNPSGHKFWAGLMAPPLERALRPRKVDR